MRNTIAVFSFILFFPTFLFSQYQDLLKNPDITWVAEFKMELSFDHNQTGENTNVVTAKKILQSKGDDLDAQGDVIAQYLYDHIINGEVLAYESPSLTIPYGFDEILNRVTTFDSTTTENPSTGEEQLQIEKIEFDPATLKTCLTKQAIYFNKKTNSLGTYLIAIAPLMERTNSEENSIQEKPLGWIRMDDLLNNSYSENLTSVLWAATIETQATPLDFSQLRAVKGSLDFRKFLYENAISGPQQVEDGRSGFGSDQLMTKEEIEKTYTNRIDSVITFDPATYTDNVEIIVSNFRPTQINNCILVQDWFYIPEKKLLANRLKAISPVIPVKDYNDQFRFYQPLYYIRY